MDKTDLLLQMMEQPQVYSADEWQQILLDDECRELYTLMSKTRSAVASARADELITNQVIDEEWQQFCESKNLEVKRKKPLFTIHYSLQKIAASFIGILLLSGVAFAAIQWWPMPKFSPKTGKTVATTDTVVVGEQSTHPTEQPEEALVTFDNVPLAEMLPKIARHHGCAVDFRTENARQLRLFFTWNPQEPLEKTIEKLNQFEHLNIVLSEETLVVESL